MNTAEENRNNLHHTKEEGTKMTPHPTPKPPTKIEWLCNSYTIRLDEDGITLTPGRTIEHSEVLQLVEAIQNALHIRDLGTSPTPRTYSRAEVQELVGIERERRTYHRIIAAIKGLAQDAESHF